MSLLSVKNVSYTYPINDWKSLDNVSLEIEKGVFYAIIGANASGKSTLCHLLRGFIPHFYKGDLQGTVSLFGKNLLQYELSDIAPRIGFLFQNPFTQISGAKETVFEEIAYGLENLGIEPDLIKEKVNEAIRLLEIEELSDLNPMELSGGQKQKVVFASVIAMDPEILIMDEPTSQLDPDGTEAIFKVINLMKQKGTTIILVEHKMDWIAEFADETIVMEDGQIAMQGPTRDILTNPELVTHGAMFPQCVELSLALREQGLINQIPLTLEEAKHALSEIGEIRGRGE